MNKLNWESTSGWLSQIQWTCLMGFLIFSNFSISLTQIFGFTGTTLWIVQTTMNKGWAKANRTLMLPIGLFLATALLATATAPEPWTSFRGIHKFLIMVIFFWAANTVSSFRPRDFFLWRNSDAESSSSGKKFLGKFKNNISSQPIPFLVMVLLLSGVVAAVSSLVTGFLFKSDTVSIWRNPGALADILSFSTILMMIALMTIARALFQAKKAPWMIVSLGILLITLLMTLSRQTWAALFVGTMALFYFKKRILIALPPVLMVLILFLAPQHIANRLLSTFDMKFVNNQERFLLWEAGWHVFKDHPVTGCGLSCLMGQHKNYESEFPIFKTYFHVHNNPLQIAIEMGALGLMAWIAIWISYFRVLWILYRRIGGDPEHQWVILGSGAVVIGFLTAGMFENSFYDSEISMVLYFLMALPLALPDASSKIKVDS